MTNGLPALLFRLTFLIKAPAILLRLVSSLQFGVATLIFCLALLFTRLALLYLKRKGLLE